jgi:hypothetical protein
MKNSQIEVKLMESEAFKLFTIQTLENPNGWKKDLLWLLSIIYASATELFVFYDQILANTNSQDYSVKSEALICLYNICENHSSKNLRNDERLFEVYVSVVRDFKANSPYILQIAISFCSLIAEKLPSTIEKY